MKKLCFLIISLVMISLNSCDTTEPELVDYHNKILFTSRRSGKEQLYMMNPDGTNIIQITSGQYWHRNGRWSPDAKKIVCNTEEGTTTAGTSMVVMNSDGSSRKLLGLGYQMSWVPDGSLILFTYSALEIKDYDAKLYSITPDGNNRKIVSDKYIGYNTFSPDGLKILFSKSDTLLRIVLLDYPSFENPFYIGPHSSGYPAYSPNSHEIAFSRTDTTNGTRLSNIYIMNGEGSNIRNISNHISEEHFFEPHWSPDGEKIIFLSYTTDGTQKSFLYMVNKDGTNLHKVIDDDSVTSCDWSK